MSAAEANIEIESLKAELAEAKRRLDQRNRELVELLTENQALKKQRFITAITLN